MRIILATDGSEYSKAAAQYLQRLGFGMDTEIHVLHVLQDYLLPDEVDPARDFKKAGLKAAESFVEEFQENLMPTQARLFPLVREGDPWREIIEAAQEIKADIVVMGHKGLKGVKKFILGDTLSHVVRSCTISTLAVRGLPPLSRPKRVLYCTDGSATARHALALFMRLPFASDTEVRVLSVVDMEVTSLPEKYYPEEEMSQMMAELREYNRKLAGKAVSEGALALMERFRDVKELVVFGAPEEEILNAAREQKSDLVVVGCKETRGLKGVLLGSEAYRIVKHTNCSVLVAKSAEP